MKGPLAYVWEELSLEAREGGTVLRYHGEFLVNNWPILGWLIGRWYVKPLFQRIVGDHMERIRGAVEARARRSHTFAPKGDDTA